MALLILSKVDRGSTGDKNKNKNTSSNNNKIIKIIKHNSWNCLAMAKHQGGKIASKLVILSENDGIKYESSLFWEYFFSQHIIYNEIKQNSNYCIHASDIVNHLNFNNQTYSQLFVKSIINHIGECGRCSLELKRGGSQDVSPQSPLFGDIKDVYDGDIDNDFYDIDSLQGYLQILGVEMTAILAVLIIIMVMTVIKEIVIQAKRIQERTANKILCHDDLNDYLMISHQPGK